MTEDCGIDWMAVWKQFAFVFNRTALGGGVLIGLWFAWRGMWPRVVGVLVLVGVYFYLHNRFDAP